MPSSFGQWLIVILALLVGLAGGWVLRGRQATTAAPQGPSIMGDDPVVGLSEEEKATATLATVDAPQSEATIDSTPAPAAVVDEAHPHDLEMPPAAASLAAQHTALPTADDTPTDTVDAPAAGTEPVAVETEPVAASTDTDRVDTPASDVDVVAGADDERADDLVPVASAGTESTATLDEVDRPADVPAQPVAATSADEVVEPTAVIPAPRAAVEDETPSAPVTGAAVASEVDTAAGDVPADDFRRIQGVGPKMAAALQDAGIRTYRQLAELDEAGLRETIRAAGLRATASLTTWPQQAKLLAGATAEADRVLPTPTGTDEQV
ncbi:hypothetical protein V6U81_16475 [Micromonospora sp. CPCC 205711]|uniref:hypothetical protein n=1 Tax=Micromonospora sp. CPCC 205547 TaxID=3122400 RepID=UPI002FEEFD16